VTALTPLSAVTSLIYCKTLRYLWHSRQSGTKCS